MVLTQDGEVAALRGDAAGRNRVGGVLAQSLFRLKVLVALDADADWPSNSFELGYPHAANFGVTRPKIAKAEG